MSDTIQLTKSDIENIKPMWHVKVVDELPEQGESGVLYVLSDGLGYKVYTWIGWWAEIECAASDYQLAKSEWDATFDVVWPTIKEILNKGNGWIVDIKEVDEEGDNAKDNNNSRDTD